MNSILQGSEHVTVYINDILATVWTETKHLQHMTKVLTSLEMAWICLKAN